MATTTETTEVARQDQPKVAPARAFRKTTTLIAESMLREWVGEERAGEAVGRISAALSASAAAARDPSDFYACTPASIGQCIAIAALTQIMPGVGATALAYVLPKRPRRNEQPQLQFWFSHRGLAALAARAGIVLIPVPVGANDEIEVTDGEVSRLHQNPDDPPMSWEDLRGVCLIVKRAQNGQTLFRGWVPKKLIDIRRRSSDTYKWAEQKGDWAKETSPWHKWPVEMAMKTAMHYAISRGWCVIDDVASTKALSVEQSQDLIASTPHPAIEEQPNDGRSRSDRLADEIDGESQSQPSETFAKRLNALNECETVEQVNYVLEHEVPVDLQNNLITDSENLALQQHGREIAAEMTADAAESGEVVYESDDPADEDAKKAGDLFKGKGKK